MEKLNEKHERDFEQQMEEHARLIAEEEHSAIINEQESAKYSLKVSVMSIVTEILENPGGNQLPRGLQYQDISKRTRIKEQLQI